MSSDPTNPPGLVILTTESILAFLTSASTRPHLSLELQQLLPISPSKPMYRASLSELFGSHPMPRPDCTGPNSSPDSEELKARLKKLAEVLERNAYAELVKDITPKKETTEPSSSYKDPLGFGYAAFRALFNQRPVMNAAGGILGLVIGMLVGTFVFIIRTSSQGLRSSSSTSKLKKNQ